MFLASALLCLMVTAGSEAFRRSHDRRTQNRIWLRRLFTSWSRKFLTVYRKKELMVLAGNYFPNWWKRGCQFWELRFMVNGLTLGKLIIIVRQTLTR